MNEQSKAAKRRFNDGNFHSRYFVGNGIEIGGAPDWLSENIGIFPLMKSIAQWEHADGDGQILEGIEDGSYDFLHSSHSLEHMVDVSEALRNWIRVVKVGGYLIITVPDEDLYERGSWPSKFNGDHKWSFTIHRPRSNHSKSINVLDLLIEFSAEVEIEKIQLIRDFFKPELPTDLDQTRFYNAECAIEIILCKR